MDVRTADGVLAYYIGRGPLDDPPGALVCVECESRAKELGIPGEHIRWGVGRESLDERQYRDWFAAIEDGSKKAESGFDELACASCGKVLAESTEGGEWE